MIGIDITTISRFKNASNKILKKILHPNELEEYNKSRNKEKFLASRWAIKESLYKADNSLVNFSNIEIRKEDDKFLYQGYNISTSVEGDLYIAIVVKEN